MSLQRRERESLRKRLLKQLVIQFTALTHLQFKVSHNLLVEKMCVSTFGPYVCTIEIMGYGYAIITSTLSVH